MRSIEVTKGTCGVVVSTLDGC